MNNTSALVVGQSADSDDDFESAVPDPKPNVLQYKANLRYGPFIRAGRRLQALMNQNGCAFVAFGQLDQGMLLDELDGDKPPKFEDDDYRTYGKNFAPDTLGDVRKKLADLARRAPVPDHNHQAALPRRLQGTRRR